MASTLVLAQLIWNLKPLSGVYLSENHQDHLSGEELLTEPDLIQRARQGDELAWADLVRQHQTAIFRLAYLLLGDPDDAEDAAQEAFIRAYRALESFDTSRPLRPWLLRITANLAHNRQRSLGRYWAALKRFGRLQDEGTLHPEARSQQSFQAQTLRDAVSRLKQSDQEVIYLRYFLNLSVEETAQAIDAAPGTVKSRSHRALKRLRALIEHRYPSLKAGFADE
jgi:RNA polymerase sigma-70 factor (ECF subfamily)